MYEQAVTHWKQLGWVFWVCCFTARTHTLLGHLSIWISSFPFPQAGMDHDSQSACCACSESQTSSVITCARTALHALQPHPSPPQEEGIACSLKRKREREKENISSIISFYFLVYLTHPFPCLYIGILQYSLYPLGHCTFSFIFPFSKKQVGINQLMCPKSVSLFTQHSCLLATAREGHFTC